jgi:hypothetical protein
MDGDVSTLMILLVALLAAAVVAMIVSRNRARQRSTALREHFGPEYQRALEQHGSRARAEKELLLRERRVQKLDLKLLRPEQCERFSAAWASVQQRFVDDPSGAVVDADRLVKEVMVARGYPMSDFDQRVADLSVEHAHVLDHYRAARNVALANAEGRAGTEDLRQAMVHYRALFTDMLEARQQPVANAPMREARV